MHTPDVPTDNAGDADQPSSEHYPVAVEHLQHHPVVLTAGRGEGLGGVSRGGRAERDDAQQRHGIQHTPRCSYRGKRTERS